MSSVGRSKRILLAGYYGFNNAGDEAVLAGLIKAFRKRLGGDEVRLTAHSIDPAGTTNLHGIPACHRYRPMVLVRSLAGTDLFASGGGSLLQDSTSAHSIYYYLATVRIAQMLGKKTMFIGQGIGPLNLPRSRRLTAKVANRLDAITVRDQGSADLLESIGVTRPPVTVTADPALLLGSDSPVANRSGCAVSLRAWQDKSDGLIELLAAAYRSHLASVPIAPMPMHSGADEAISGRFAEAVTGAALAFPSRSLFGLLDVAAHAEMVIGMRLHALIFAAASVTPMVAISYDPKVAAFMDQIGQSDLVYDLELSPKSQLAEIVARGWAERHTRRDALLARLPVLRNAAQMNADIALGLLG